MTTKTPAKRTARRTRAKLLSSQWAIREETLRTMVAILERRGSDLSAIMKEAGDHHDETFETRVRDGVAYMNVSGVLSRYMSFFTYICGGQSYELLANDLGTLLKDPDVKAVVWEIDSPGGEVNGCSDLARLIYESREIKPQIAFISGDGCSAAYWLASACAQVVASDTAVVGCLGCQAAWLDDRKQLEREGLEEISIVSSQTPNKNQDAMTDEGRAAVQRVVDALADRFIDSVATYRGVSRDVVLTTFGAGDVFVGEAARLRGMVDAISTIEQLHLGLTAPASTSGASLGSPVGGSVPSGSPPALNRGVAMKTKTTTAALAKGETAKALVTREVSIAQDDEGTISEVREGVNVVAFETADGNYLWLLDSEVQSTAAAADATPPAGDSKPAAPAAGDTCPTCGGPMPCTKCPPQDMPAAQAPGKISTVAQLAAAFPALVATLRGAAIAAERARILGIVDITPTGQEAMARQCIEQGTDVGASATQFLKQAGGEQRARLAAFTQPAFTAPAADTPAADGDSASSTVERIRKASRAALGTDN